jgi:hypothetical protein
VPRNASNALVSRFDIFDRDRWRADGDLRAPAPCVRDHVSELGDTSSETLRHEDLAVIGRRGKSTGLLELIKRDDLFLCRDQIVRRPALDRTTAVAIRRELGGNVLRRDLAPHDNVFKQGADARGREALRVGIVPPAVGVDRHAHRLAAVADEMGEQPEVSDREAFADPLVLQEPSSLGGCLRVARAGDIRAPMGEIHHHLLPRIDDRVRQIARAILVQTRGS